MFLFLKTSVILIIWYSSLRNFIIKLFTFKTSILIFDQTVLTLSRIDFEFEFFLTQLLFEKNKTHISQDFWGFLGWNLRPRCHVVNLSLHQKHHYIRFIYACFFFFSGFMPYTYKKSDYFQDPKIFDPFRSSK